MEKKQTKDNNPAQQLRAGALSVSIWEKQHDGKTFWSATPSRAFTRDDGKTWEYSDQFGRDDLPVVSRLMDMAFAWIVVRGGEK